MNEVKRDAAGIPINEPRAEALARVEGNEKKATEASAPQGNPLPPGVYLLNVEQDGRFKIDGELLDRAVYPLCNGVQLTAFVKPWPGSPLEKAAQDFYPGTRPGSGPAPPVTNNTIVGVPTQEEHIIGGNADPAKIIGGDATAVGPGPQPQAVPPSETACPSSEKATQSP